MLTMSKAIGAAQARDYYQREYTNVSESYSAEHLSGEWHGRLAEEWGLQGSVEREHYERLCDGQHPLTGEELVRHAPARTYVNRYGDKITSSGHRAGWDLTFSAPKSVSLSAVAAGDDRVRQAHRESVDKALDEVERYTQARIGGNHPAVTTGRIVAAKFEHDAARPDRAARYAAPQLHTHALVFNVTQMEDGRTRAIQPLEMYRSQQLATAVYRINLAERLQDLGYEVEVDTRTGAPEIKGYSPEYLQESSPRSAEIRREAELMKARIESEGASVKEGAGLRQAAARADRASKEYDRAAMRERVRELEAKYGYQAHRLYEQSIERGSLARSREEIFSHARASVVTARAVGVECGEDVDMRQLWSRALNEGASKTTYEAVKLEMEASVARGEFIGLVRKHQMGAEAPAHMALADKTIGQKPFDERGRANEQIQDQKSSIEYRNQSLLHHSLDESSAVSSSDASDSFESSGNENLSAGTKEVAEEQVLENAIELGFAL